MLLNEIDWEFFENFELRIFKLVCLILYVVVEIVVKIIFSVGWVDGILRVI